MLPRTGLWSINEAILVAGQATADNLPPRLGIITYAFRSPSLIQQEQIFKVLQNNAEATAKATGCMVKTRWVAKTRTGLFNKALAELAYENLELIGAPKFTEEDKEKAREIIRNLGYTPPKEPYNEKLTPDGLEQALGTGVETLLEKLNRLIAERTGLANAQATVRSALFDVRLDAALPDDQIQILKNRGVELWESFYKAAAADQPGIAQEIADNARRLSQARASADSIARISAAQAINDEIEANRQARDLRVDGLRLELDTIDARRNALEDEINAVRRITDIAQRLKDTVAEIRFSDLSPLNPGQQVKAAGEYFFDVLRRAQAGDEGALSSIGGVAQQYLSESQHFFGNTRGYVGIYSNVMSELDRLGITSTAERG